MEREDEVRSIIENSPSAKEDVITMAEKSLKSNQIDKMIEWRSPLEATEY